LDDVRGISSQHQDAHYRQEENGSLERNLDAISEQYEQGYDETYYTGV
jgi:hypothetical protein